jgi:Icc protein
MDLAQANDGKVHLERYGKNTKGKGWHSFEQKGVHFAGLSNVMALEGLGKLAPINSLGSKTI